ncbi:MAG TPA: phytanoyl-CoA dioxygenase family protein [Armatimonadota bacterium]|nr:phytanoyl-CoA dioxygenase family protein [Armatimonadota bacterium]
MNELERYLFDLQGFLVVEDALSPERVDRLNAVIDAHTSGVKGHDGSDARIYGFVNWEEPDFRNLIDLPIMIPYLKELLGEGFRLDHEYGMYMGPGIKGLGLHGGGAPFSSDQFYHCQNGKISNGLTVVSYALTDVAPGDGGFCCVPGSHKANFPCPAALRRFEINPGCVTQIPVRSGSALIFTEALTHGTLDWNAPYERRAALFKYSPAHESWGRAGRSEETLARMTPRQRQILEPPYIWQRKVIDI